MEIVYCTHAGLSLPYPARNFWPELILLLIVAVVDGIRIFLCKSSIIITLIVNCME